MLKKTLPWMLIAPFVFSISMVSSFSVSAESALKLWSHWADHETKVRFVETAVRNFEKKNPGVKVKITWYQKKPLYSALKIALSAGKGPDIFYTEVGQTEYIDNGMLLPLDKLVNWDNVEPWARKAWTFNGQTYGFPLETQTVELYYNKKLMRGLGISLPANGQVSQGKFLQIVKKSVSAGITPFAQGVGDRPYPGLYVSYELLLRRLGKADYGKLLRGRLSYQDSRVVETLTWVKSLIDAGAYPKSFATIKLGESHYYFHTRPGALMFPIGSWYTSRAFNPPDKGGQPVGFPLGIMSFPAMNGGACNNCKTKGIGGSFSINASTKHPKLAAGVLNEMATPEMGNLWLNTVLVQSGVKGDPSKIKGKYKSYFKELTRINQGTDSFIGLPHQLSKGKCGDALRQVMNVAFPGGFISVKRAIQEMDRACYKG